MYDLDVVIFGSSRPQLVPYMWKAFNKYCHFRGNRRVIVHEDFVIPEQSERSMDIWHELERNGEIQEVHHHDRAIGLGFAMDAILKQRVKSKYMLYLQEDWLFEIPIDLDRLIFCMEESEKEENKVNLIVFNKIKNTGSLSGISQPQGEFPGNVSLCLYASWSFMCGLWKMPFIMKYLNRSQIRRERPEGFVSNIFGSHEERSSNEYCKKNIGAYLYGKTGDWRVCRHLGNDLRCASWRIREDGTPGGCNDYERMDYPYMAPWVELDTSIPTYKDIYGNDKKDEDIDAMLAEEAGMS